MAPKNVCKACGSLYKENVADSKCPVCKFDRELEYVISGIIADFVELKIRLNRSPIVTVNADEISKRINSVIIQAWPKSEKKNKAG